MQLIKDLVNQVIFDTRIPKLSHFRRNATNLTIVTFHRVIDKKDPRWPEAEHMYACTTKEFEICLKVFSKHYNIVTLQDIINFKKQSTPLPDCPLLITFDDAWHDVYQYAYPLLKKYQMKAALFIVNKFIGRIEPHWEDKLFGVFKRNQLTHEDFTHMLAHLPDENQQLFKGQFLSEANFVSFKSKLSCLPQDLLEECVDYLYKKYPTQTRYYASKEELEEMSQDCFEISYHTNSHYKLTQSTRLYEELILGWQQMPNINKHKDILPKAIAFPYGDYDQKIIDFCTQEKFDLLFTCKETLNPIDSVKKGNLLHRVNIGSSSLWKNAAFTQRNLAHHLTYTNISTD